MPSPPDPGRQMLNYHERTKHHLHRLARSPATLDWDNQPAAFRTYAGARTIPLPLAAADPPLDYADLFQPAAAASTPMDRSAAGTFFELSLALSAWKAIPGHRWALRINPSSGNLHPTEAHLIALGVHGLPDGIYHYHPLAHGLEERATFAPRQSRTLEATFAPPCLLVALSTIFWREAWKYGERAFRYCQHDVGHALAALRLAARVLGWRLVHLQAADADIAAAMGFDRTPWPPVETEEPALIAAVQPAAAPALPRTFPGEAAGSLGDCDLAGRPSRLSPRHRSWEILAQAAAAGRRHQAPDPVPPAQAIAAVVHPAPRALKAVQVIRQRRSAQAFDPQGRLGRKAFLSLLDRTRPRAASPPFDIGLEPPQISLVLFVHQVRGVSPGLYAFIRHPEHFDAMRRCLSKRFRWESADPDLPLYLLAPGDLRAEAIDLSCRQEIAGWSTFSLAMLARFEPIVRETPWIYRQLFWEAGLIGQVLYLEAEAQGVRGTGIGCYFDDPVHDHLGLTSRDWQSLYHFTIGVPLEDERLQTLPPYFHLAPDRRGSDRDD